MRNLVILITMVVFPMIAFPSDHGMYLLTMSNVQQNINHTSKLIESKLVENGFHIQSNLEIKTPDYVREDSTELCRFETKLDFPLYFKRISNA